MPRCTPILACLAAPIAFLAAPAAAQPIYSYTVIGGIPQPPPTGPISQPLALNNNGRVVGYGFNAGGNIQALNWKGGLLSNLGGVSTFDRTFANKVNILGRIAGAGYHLDSTGGITQTHALKWVGGVMTDIGSLGGAHAAALAINDYDQVVGYSTTAGETSVRAFIHQNGAMTPISTLPGATESYAYDISNTGYIVGTAVAGAPAKPFTWRAGVATQLPTPSWSRTGAANAVNDSGQAVGTYEINQYTGAFAATMWVNGVRTDLGCLGGPLAYSTAADINNYGQIVGTSNSAHGYTGYLWQGGHMFDLRDLVVGNLEITSASSINDRGQIAAAALINGRQTAVLLTPIVPNVPAPAGAAALFIAGLFVARRGR
jgi:probable HAF family extracellular repeat protein